MAIVEPVANNELANSNVMRSPSEPYSKERAKFEATHTEVGPGKRPYVYHPYPAMMYLAGKPEGISKVTIIETQVVESREQEDYPRSRGFRPTPQEALKHYDDEQTEFMKLAGNLNYQVKNTLSERAGAEVLAAMDQHNGHLASVPVTPIKKRGRPVRVKETV
jgi:hypothetical protein